MSPSVTRSTACRVLKTARSRACLRSRRVTWKPRHVFRYFQIFAYNHMKSRFISWPTTFNIWKSSNASIFGLQWYQFTAVEDVLQRRDSTAGASSVNQQITSFICLWMISSTQLMRTHLGNHPHGDAIEYKALTSVVEHDPWWQSSTNCYHTHLVLVISSLSLQLYIYLLFYRLIHNIQFKRGFTIIIKRILTVALLVGTSSRLKSAGSAMDHDLRTQRPLQLLGYQRR